MMQSPGVQNAINYFNQKNAGKCPSQWAPVKGYDYSFGLKGLWQSGLNSTQQFVGSYSVNIYPNANGTIDVQVYNTTSMTSFFYGIYPKYAWNPSNGWPMGNTSQEMNWERRRARPRHRTAVAGTNREFVAALRNEASALLFVISLLAGCSSHYTSADLAGRYVLAVDGGTDTIELEANGKYLHSYAVKKAEKSGIKKTRGILEDLQAGPTVVLNNFHSLAGEDARERGSYRLLLVKRVYGELYLITNIDLNEGYKKQ